MREKNTIKVIIIAHGGKQCGMGHVMRTLSLATQFSTFGCNVQYISKYIEGIRVIKDHNYYVHELNIGTLTESFCSYKDQTYTHNAYDETIGHGLSDPIEISEDPLYLELKIILDILEKEKPHIVIVDTYSVTSEFFIKLKEKANIVVYIDDLYSFDYPVDVIVNGNITGTDMGYLEKPFCKKYLLGISYNLIRNEFSNLPKRYIASEGTTIDLKNEASHVKNIMITTGASDPANLTTKFLQVLMQDNELKNLQYHVVIGAGFEYKEEILAYALSYDTIHCYQNPDRISEIMLSSDLAITAGGSTLYELSACGTPMLSFIYAENQRKVVEKMEKEGYLINLGCYEIIDYEALKDTLKKIIKNKRYRREVSEKIQQLVDGYGAKRVVEEILKIT